MRKYQNKKIWTLILYTGGFGLLGTGAYFADQDEPIALSATFIGVGAITMIASIIVNASITDNVYKATWYYNKYILQKKMFSSVKASRLNNTKINICNYSVLF